MMRPHDAIERDRAAAALWRAAWRKRRRDRLAAGPWGRFVGNVNMLAAILFIIILASLAWGVSRALAHGPADWIQRGGYKNMAGELCCGERDCRELADGDVKVTAAGYTIASTGETVPFSEATPSPDGKFWRCAWGGRRKCFFAPPGDA